MKHNFIRKLLSVMLSCSVMALGCVNVSSEEYSALNSLEVYKHKFELLNEKYGTDFHIATFNMTETELNDLLTDYLNMTDEEFETYFIDMKEKSDDFLKRQSEQNVIYCENEMYATDDLLREDVKFVSSKFIKGTTINHPQDFINSSEDTDDNDEKSTLETIAAPYSSPNVLESQFYFYQKASPNALGISAYVNYSPGWGQYISVYEVGSINSDDYFPQYVLDKNTRFEYEINNYYQSSQMECHFPCYYYVSKGVTSGMLMYVNVTFTAGKGNISAS